MPYITPKSRQAASWLPTQVAYGIDCSDEDPSKWTHFGHVFESQQAEQAKHDAKAAKASGPPTQSAPAER